MCIWQTKTHTVRPIGDNKCETHVEDAKTVRLLPLAGEDVTSPDQVVKEQEKITKELLSKPVSTSTDIAQLKFGRGITINTKSIYKEAATYDEMFGGAK